ncbi:helix-turn-helix domain-containing protein [Sutterella megalosphaeroides]|nr:helix-turn-helix domain-containing protein [Sutterella megalosphaeroides]
MTKEDPTIVEKAATQGFGEELRQAREAAGISLGDMAVKCRLSVMQIRALESEDMSQLPEPVYVRAFIRGYAQQLGLDPARLQADYNARYGRTGGNVGQVPVANPNEEQVIRSNSRHRGLKVSLFFVFILIVAAGAWGLYTDRFGSNVLSEAEKVEEGVNEVQTPAATGSSGTTGTTGTTETAPAQTAPAASAPVPTPAPASQPAATAAQPAAPASSAAPAAPAAPAAEPAQTASTASVAPARAAEEPAQADPAAPVVHRVTLATTASCWVQVTGPAGERIVAREMKAGDSHTVDVPSGSRFTIGNGRALTLSVDGKAYDYAFAIRNGVARFALQ